MFVLSPEVTAAAAAEAFLPAAAAADAAAPVLPEEAAAAAAEAFFEAEAAAEAAAELSEALAAKAAAAAAALSAATDALEAAPFTSAWGNTLALADALADAFAEALVLGDALGGPFALGAALGVAFGAALGAALGAAPGAALAPYPGPGKIRQDPVKTCPKRHSVWPRPRPKSLAASPALLQKRLRSSSSPDPSSGGPVFRSSSHTARTRSASADLENFPFLPDSPPHAFFAHRAWVDHRTSRHFSNHSYNGFMCCMFDIMI